VRIKQLGAADSNVRQRINSGIAVYWAAHVEYDFLSFLHDRNVERGKFRDLAEWKKVLLQKQYKVELNDDKRKALYFFIVGYNNKSGELALATSPDMETILWITPGELRKYSYMLWEPSL
jgi:hypothetical protein